MTWRYIGGDMFYVVLQVNIGGVNYRMSGTVTAPVHPWQDRPGQQSFPPRMGETRFADTSRDQGHYQ